MFNFNDRSNKVLLALSSLQPAIPSQVAAKADISICSARAYLDTLAKYYYVSQTVKGVSRVYNLTLKGEAKLKELLSKR